MAKPKMIKGTVGDKTVEYKEMTIKESFVVFITTLVGISIPTAIFSFFFVKITTLNIYVSTFIGLIMTILLVFAFGWHKPAYANGKKSEEDAED
ncbi:hypothetical protein [Bacillus sp. NPDC094106]|uniref:hypothetical protein n=1 Tax=Bacillus sp. NPDC094106 TaxID=3363949 RepID=UPI00381E64DC